MTVGAFLITKDSAELIPAVAACLQSFADRVIVCVDSQATDNSIDVARATGAETITRDVVKHTYETTLNRIVAMLDTDWVFYLHDDELVGPAFLANLPLMLTSRIAWRFVHYNLWPDDSHFLTSQPYTPDYQLRLIPRHMWLERGGWPEHIHSSPAWPCNFADTGGIFHYKFLVKTQAFRQARLDEWRREWIMAASEHYRAFSIVEGREVETAPIPEAAPLQRYEAMPC